jgi:hypothetical protein
VPLFSILFGGDAEPDLKVSASIGAGASGDGTGSGDASIDADAAGGPDAFQILPVGDAPFLQDFGGDASAETVAGTDAEVGSIISTMTDTFVDDSGLLS